MAKLFKSALKNKTKTDLIIRSYSKKAANNTENLQGIFPQLTTPFHQLKDEKIAWKHLEENINQLNQSQPFTGFVINGFFGESPLLSFKERMNLVKVVSKLVGPKKTIIVSSDSECLKKTIYTCELMKNCGANYVLLHAPSYYLNHMTDASILEYYTKVADKSPLPIIIDNVPSQTQIDFSAELCLEMSYHPNIVGLKESSNNIGKISMITEEIRSTDRDFNVIAGSAHFLLEALRAGAVGGVSILANVLGHKLIELFKLHNKNEDLSICDKNLEKANSLQNRLIQPDLALNETYGVPGLKAALEAYGLYGGPCRQPLQELNEKEINHLKSIFEQNGFPWHSLEDQSIFCRRVSYRGPL